MSIEDRIAITDAFRKFKRHNHVDLSIYTIINLFLAGFATWVGRMIPSLLDLPIKYQELGTYVCMALVIIIYCIIGISWCHLYATYHKANQYANYKIQNPVIYRQDVKKINAYHIHLELPSE